MLVLDRKFSEKIILEVAGERIEVVVVKIRPASVKIGIAASRAVNVVREELLPEIPKEAIG